MYRHRFVLGKANMAPFNIVTIYESAVDTLITCKKIFQLHCTGPLHSRYSMKCLMIHGNEYNKPGCYSYPVFYSGIVDQLFADPGKKL